MAMAAVVTVALAACAAAPEGAPAIVIDRTACAHCGMLVSEVRHAAASRIAGEPARVFDDIGCLLDDVRSTNRRPSDLWFHDAESGEWIVGPAAFIHDAAARTPMSGGLLAYASLETARREAARRGGALIPTTADLLSRGRP